MPAAARTWTPADAHHMPPIGPSLPRTLLALPVALALLAVPAPVIADSTGGSQYGQASQAPAPVPPTAPVPVPTPAPGTSPAGIDPSKPVPSPGPLTPVPAPLPGQVARLLPTGLAVAPPGAPVLVRQIIAAGNLIALKRYLWGGGHRRWEDRGYDCSGSVSYALRGAGLLDAPLVSGGLARWGEPGPGSWVTIYANAGHVYMVVAGLRFDTSGRRKAGTRWQVAARSSRGFRVRHPAGL